MRPNVNLKQLIGPGGTNTPKTKQEIPLPRNSLDAAKGTQPPMPPINNPQNLPNNMAPPNVPLNPLLLMPGMNNPGQFPQAMPPQGYNQPVMFDGPRQSMPGYTPGPPFNPGPLFNQPPGFGQPPGFNQGSFPYRNY